MGSKRRELKKAKAAAEAAEREELSRRVKEEAPASVGEDGRVGLEEGAARLFTELPLSSRTQAGLRAAGYERLTAVQAASLPHALAGRDVVGTARTGSGKTLCYLVPLLETLFRAGWQSGGEGGQDYSGDGLGALVVLPTRELALQVFQVLRRVGARHSQLSAGLAIGGKDAQEEEERVGRMAVLVGTPGRLLHHLDRAPALRVDDLRLLVLDEADRLLDPAFRATLDPLLAHLPPAPRRQTLLFSATQTAQTRSLPSLTARLRMHPAGEMLAVLRVHAEAAAATPARLRQSYCVVEPHRKLDFVFGFLRSHSRHKTLVFLSTCKQVKFVYEAFRHLHPGVPIMCLHGRLAQLKRMAVYDAFCRTRHAALFCTDVASRGLDFPDLDWVLQADCPDDPTSYVHRVGRTARYAAGGRALLLLSEREAEGFLPALAAHPPRPVPIELLRADPSRLPPLADRLAALCAQLPELRHLAQRALATYLRSVHLQAHKATFDVHSIDVPKLSASYGLPFAPQVRFSASRHADKNQNLVVKQLRQHLAKRTADGSGWSSSSDESDSEQRERTRYAIANSDDDDDDNAEAEQEAEKASSSSLLGRKRSAKDKSGAARSSTKKSLPKQKKTQKNSLTLRNQGEADDDDQDQDQDEDEDDLMVVTKRYDPNQEEDAQSPPKKKKKNRRRGSKKKKDGEE